MSGESRWFISFVKTPFLSHSAGNVGKWEKMSVMFLVPKNLIALGSDLSLEEEVLALHRFTALVDQEWH